MAGRRPYSYPEAVTAQEFVAVASVFLGARRIMQPPALMMRMWHNALPLRLEFEVNRLRGFAFDSGEAGFSHTQMETP